MTFSAISSKSFRAVSLLLLATIGICRPLAAQTTTTLSITVKGGQAVTTVAAGTLVILTATVGVHPGQVKFCDATASYCTDQHLLGMAQLTPAGKATYKFIPGIGKHSYKAVFVGTQSETGSTSTTESLAVTGAVAITSSGSPGNYTLGATIAGGVNPVTGTVSFEDTSNGNAKVSSAAVTNTNIALSFASSALSKGSNSSYGIGAGDLNGDGLEDLAVVNTTSGGGLSIFLSNGDGTFTQGTTAPTGTYPAGPVAFGDFNGDGNLDVAVSNTSDGTISILLGAGNGTFAAQPVVKVGDGPVYVATGDFNGDGIADLVVVNENANSINILLGKGDGSFVAQTPIMVGANPVSASVADYNGDGIADIAVANDNDETVSILLGVGNGTFAAQPVLRVRWSGLVWAIAGDVNGDGIADLVTVNSGSNNVAIFLGKGDGTFYQNPEQATVTVGNFPYAVALADFDGDGTLDIVTDNLTDATASILLNQGDGRFRLSSSPTLGAQPYPITVGDFNGDGRMDIVATDEQDDNVSILINQGGNSGVASVSNVSIPGNGTHAVLASYGGDANNPASASGTVDLTATQVPTTLTVSASPAAATYGQQVVLTAKLTPYSSGNLSTNTESIVFQNNGGNIGSESLTSGQAVLNITSLPVGSNSITAVYGGDSNFVTSVSAAKTVTVSAAGPALTITPASLSFASTAVGTTTAAQMVTLKNTSGSPVSFTAATTITGSGASSFIKSASTCTNPLPAGASCTNSIEFDPASAGALSAVITYTDSAAGSPQTVALSGTGASSGPTLTFSPTSLSFASTAVGTTTAAQMVTIKNTSGSPVSFTAATTITGGGASSFIKSASTCTNPLPAGASCTNSIEFDPASAGALSAVITYTDTAAGSPQTVGLSGTGASSGATLSISPASLSFASTAVGTTTAAQMVTIKNTGTSAVSFTAATTITGSGASSFIKSASTCTNPLPAGASCTNSIEFDPASAGALSAVITYTDSAAGSPQTVALSGTGASSGPSLSISPASLSFAPTAVGTTTAAQMVTIKNTSASPVSFTAATTITGSGASSFIKSASTCTNPLPAGASCTNSIEFDPTAMGALSAVITYTDSAAGSPQTVALSGTGASSSPTLTFSPTSLSFASTAVGTTTAAQMVTITNTSVSAVSFTATTTITGGGASSFTKSASTCTNPLPAGASCTNSIEFDPASAGALSAVITYTDTAAGSPQTVGLSGTGH